MLTCPDRKRYFDDYMTTRAGELSFADKAAEFAKDELKVPDINLLNIEHAKKPLMDTLQEVKDNWKAGIDERSYLKEGAKFYLTTKRFELQGIVKHFPIYNLIVETCLLQFDRSMVFNLGITLTLTLTLTHCQDARHLQLPVIPLQHLSCDAC